MLGHCGTRTYTKIPFKKINILPTWPRKKQKYFFSSDQKTNPKWKTNGKIGLFAAFLLYDCLRMQKFLTITGNSKLSFCTQYIIRFDHENVVGLQFWHFFRGFCSIFTICLRIAKFLLKHGYLFLERTEKSRSAWIETQMGPATKVAGP